VVVISALAAGTVVAASLALAPATWAQAVSDAPTPVPRRIEIGLLGGVSATSPEIGALVSIPLEGRLSLDLGLGNLTRVWRAGPYVLSQAQLRIPFRHHLRSRRSLVVGVTHVKPYRERDGDSGIWGTEPPLVYPHVGTSLQWAVGAHADFRVDTQIVIQFNDVVIPVVPRAVAAFVWHPWMGGSR
jgi:hypothetical protein